MADRIDEITSEERPAFLARTDSMLLPGLLLVAILPAVICLVQTWRLRSRLAAAEQQALQAQGDARQARAEKLLARDEFEALRKRLLARIDQRTAQAARSLVPPKLDTSRLVTREKLAAELTAVEQRLAGVQQSLESRLAGAARTTDLAGLARKQDLTGLVRKDQVAGLARKQDLSGLATRRELHLLTGGLIFKIEGLERKLVAAPAEGPHGKANK